MRQQLGSHGYDVTVATTVHEARQLLVSLKPDVCIVDLVMPGTSGKVFCREIAETTEARIIVASAESDLATRNALFELGADDYLIKPFEPLELAMRVKALLRRKAPLTVTLDQPLRIGRWLYERRLRRLQSDCGDSMALTSSEARLLDVFAANPNIVFTRESLLALCRVRQHGGKTDRSVDMLIKRLRAKVEDNPRMPAFIQTVWGQGYAFRPDKDAAAPLDVFDDQPGFNGSHP